MRETLSESTGPFLWRRVWREHGMKVKPTGNCSDEVDGMKTYVDTCGLPELPRVEPHSGTQWKCLAFLHSLSIPDLINARALLHIHTRNWQRRIIVTFRKRWASEVDHSTTLKERKLDHQKNFFLLHSNCHHFIDLLTKFCQKSLF